MVIIVGRYNHDFQSSYAKLHLNSVSTSILISCTPSVRSNLTIISFSFLFVCSLVKEFFAYTYVNPTFCFFFFQNNRRDFVRWLGPIIFLKLISKKAGLFKSGIIKQRKISGWEHEVMPRVLVIEVNYNRLFVRSRYACIVRTITRM